jgi:hypothetical protein
MVHRPFQISSMERCGRTPVFRSASQQNQRTGHRSTGLERRRCCADTSQGRRERRGCCGGDDSIHPPTLGLLIYCSERKHPVPYTGTRCGSFIGGFAIESRVAVHGATSLTCPGAAAWIQNDRRGRRSRDAGGCKAAEDWLGTAIDWQIKLFISGLSALFLLR